MSWPNTTIKVGCCQNIDLFYGQVHQISVIFIRSFKYSSQNGQHFVKEQIKISDILGSSSWMVAQNLDQNSTNNPEPDYCVWFENGPIIWILNTRSAQKYKVRIFKYSNLPCMSPLTWSQRMKKFWSKADEKKVHPKTTWIKIKKGFIWLNFLLVILLHV